MKNKLSPSLLAFLFCCIFLTSVCFIVRKWEQPRAQALISWDIAGYYLYLPSFFYDDLGKLNNIPYIIEKYDPFGGAFYSAFKMPDGNHVMKYSSGQAIMFLPGFAASHVWAKYGGYPVDGFSRPYQIGLALNSLFVSFLGLWIMRKILLRFFKDYLVAIAILILCLATNYLNYTSIVGAFTHGYIFTLYSLIIYLSIRFYERPTYLKTFALGLLSGLATITRPTEIIVVLIPLLWAVSSKEDAIERVKLLMAHWPKIAVYVICASAIGSIQLFYWKTYSGHWMHWSYGQEETFSFLHPHFINGVFSYRKGWLVYTPVMLLAIIGLVPLYLNYRKIFWGIVVFIAINFYLVFSWDCWWYGGSFSQRAVIQSYAFWLFPLTAFFDMAVKRMLYWVPALFFILFCTWFNLHLTWQANSHYGIMECDMMTRAYFWRIFGKTRISRNDLKLLDTDEEMPASFEKGLSEIFSADFENFQDSDVSAAHGGTHSILLSHERQNYDIPVAKGEIKEGWYRARLQFYPVNIEWNKWEQPQITIYIKKNGKEIKNKAIRAHHICDQGQWNEIYVDMQVNKDADELGVRLWNANGYTTSYCDDLKVLYAREE